MDVALAAEPPATMPLEASPGHNPEEKRSAFQKPKGEVVEKPDEPKEKKTEKDEKDEKENINPKESEISPEIPSSGLYDDFTVVIRHGVETIKYHICSTKSVSIFSDIILLLHQ